MPARPQLIESLIHDMSTLGRLGVACAALALLFAYWSFRATSSDGPAPNPHTGPIAATDSPPCANPRTHSMSMDSKPDISMARRPALDANASEDVKPPQVIDGLVVGVDGTPIATASVAIACGGKSSVVSTNSLGSYTVTLTDANQDGSLEVRAWHPDYQPARLEQAIRDLRETEKSTLSPLVLRRGCSIVGRAVRGRHGATRAQVVIATEPASKLRSISWCDPDGWFCVGLADHSIGLPLRLTINHGILGTAERSVVPSRGLVTDLGDVQLSAATTVSGRLVTPSGVPFDNLAIKVASVSGNILDGRVGCAVWRTVTDSGGGFTLDGMVAGVHQVYALGTMREASSEDIPTVISGQECKTIVLTGCRITLTCILDGERVPESGLLVRWHRLDKVWSALNPDDSPLDKLVPAHSTWRVDVEGRDQRMRGSITVNAVQEERVIGTIVLMK